MPYRVPTEGASAAKPGMRTAASLPIARLCLASLFAMLSAGCGDRLQTAQPVDRERAIAALRTTLESWQAGGTPADLRERNPEIVAQDISWSDGARLLEYDLLELPQPVDANLLCSVRLRLAPAGGQPTERTVVYIVGTDPVLTVFRQMP